MPARLKPIQARSGTCPERRLPQLSRPRPRPWYPPFAYLQMGDTTTRDERRKLARRNFVTNGTRSRPICFKYHLGNSLKNNILTELASVERARDLLVGRENAHALGRAYPDAPPCSLRGHGVGASMVRKSEPPILQITQPKDTLQMGAARALNLALFQYASEHDGAYPMPANQPRKFSNNCSTKTISPIRPPFYFPMTGKTKPTTRTA